MPTKARVVVLPGEPGPLQLVDVTLPDPGPYQVVVRQRASGICHSQLHQIRNPRDGQSRLLGDEGTGEVVATGSEVTHVRPGDSVLLTWVPRDGEGTKRRAGWFSLEAPDGRIARSPNIFTWADTTMVDEQNVFPLPPGFDTDVVAITGCAVMTGSGAVIDTANVQAGQSVAVFGVGGIGTAVINAARIRGADPIIAVDLDDEKLAFAQRFGATHTVNSTKEDPVARIRELTQSADLLDPGGKPVAGAHFAFDCIGVRQTMEQILASSRTGSIATASGGTAVLVGVPKTTVELPARDLLVNERRFIGSFGGSCRPMRDFPIFLQWYRDGQLDLDKYVTRRFPLEKVNEAAAALDRGEITGRALLVM